MANTMTLIASVTVGAGGAATIDFTSIPSSYTDLKILHSARTNRADTNDFILVQLNGSTTSLSGKRAGGSGSATFTYSVAQGPGGEATAANATASIFGNSEIYITNYSGSTNKSWSADGVPENNATQSYMEIDAGLWSNTAAITSIKLLPEVGTLFNQYSTAYLYGISKS